ncbi:zinc finger protein 585A-like isoform X2 [Rana temporaria]|nr:zinc finger protein 585A-like isoform X2 [Rana temporaria]
MWREDEGPPEGHDYEDSTSSEEGIFTDTENDTSRDCARYSCRILAEDSGEERRLPQEDILPQTSSGLAKSELPPNQEAGLPCRDTVTPTDPTPVTSSRVKAEPNLYKDLDIDSPASADRRPYTPPHIKEEPLSDEEGHIPESDLSDPMDCSRRSSIREESWDEGDFPNSGLYTHHGQYISAHIKTESASGGNNLRKRWPCFECGKTLSTRSNLFVHQRSHVRKKPFACAECGKGFSSRGYLAIHRRNHTGERPFACSECGESYTAKSQLLRHQTKLHSDRRFVCADCGRCFIVRSALNEHRKIHSGEKPFSCAECGRCFNRKSNLMSHYKVHTGEKPHGCPDCSKSFTTKSVLRAHQRIHMGLKFRS